MSASLKTLEAEALKLSSQERVELIERLIDSVVPAPPLHPAWAAEIARRIDEIDSGRVEMIPAERVFAEVRAAIEAHSRKT